MKVSVIVPVYNSEQYLENAVNSILTQSLQDIEIILVDDCATDKSGQICDELAKKDLRIKVIHAENNGGICKARNMGMAIAQGEYIAFCDDDDIYEPGLLEQNYNLAKKYNADMVKFGRKLIDVLKDGTVVREKDTNGDIERVYNLNTKYKDYYYVRKKGYLTNLWNGIYKNDTVKKHELTFDENMRFGSEDMDFSIKVFDIADCIVINPITYYVHYRRDASSTSRKFNTNKIDSIMTTASHEYNIWSKMSDTIDTKVQIDRIISEYIRTIITLQLNHKCCPYSDTEKVQWIKKISQAEYMHMHYDKAVKKILFKTDKKCWITTLLLEKHKYKMLLFVMKSYQTFFGEKW